MLVLALAGLLSGVLALAPGAFATSHERTSFQGEEGGLPDLDARSGRVQPTAEQRRMVERLGATVRWNDFGTPHSLIRHGGFLGTGLPQDAEQAARRWIAEHRALFRLSERGLERLELLNEAKLGDGSALLFRQRFGGLPAAQDGLLAVGVRDGKVAYVSSSIAGDGTDPAEPTLSATQAYRRAADDAGRPVGAADISNVRRQRGWTTFDASGFTEPQRARLRALPIPAGGVRAVWETIVLDNGRRGPLAFTHFVDARTGEVLFRQDRVDHQSTVPFPPKWRVFPMYPPLDTSTNDTRVLWCWETEVAGAPVPGCERALDNLAARAPWDVDPRTGLPTFTTKGNAASSAQSASFLTPAEQLRPVSPTREYDFRWTNQWAESRCNPSSFASPQRNDIDAATANLFAMHNRVHDWSYFLGFTEQNFNLQDSNFGLTDPDRQNDPELGDAQAGAPIFGAPTFLGRDNANQITLPDGIPGITNMYLWQPIAGAFYPPCVDGDFDMSVIAHEYTHAISNRMVGGPDAGLSGPQARAMGESWSDLNAVEYPLEYGFVPIGDENPFAVGAYVTGDPKAGIRNYGMNESPLNYSDVGYDLTGPQVHADGEIWSAVNFDIRQALIDKYGGEFPAGDATLQRRCADGELPADRCPGNRRWVQIVHDAFLLMPPRVSMVDARDAYLAADMVRFGGANQAELWREFAAGGLGEGAASDTTEDDQPVPSFESPLADDEAAVSFKPVARGAAEPRDVEIFVGHYEGRATPVADTDPETERGSDARFVPGTYDLIARADGFGAVRFSETFRPGKRTTVRIPMAPNLASSSAGASATGDGVNLESLIDDTEATNWASLGSDGTDSPERSVEGRQVTVDLAGDGAQTIRRVQVSAMLRPRDREDEGGDTGSQNRFSALRQFEIQTCVAGGGTSCTDDGDFSTVFTSAPDAFPAVAPRPRAPDLILRSFEIPASQATHVRLRVLTNQCTGTPDFQGDQDADPTNDSDCPNGDPLLIPSQAENVRAAELQVFSTR